MIKQRRSAFILCLTVLIGAIMMLAACGNNGGTSLGNTPEGKVSDSQWSEKLDINIEACKSCTIVTQMGANYTKDKVDVYGEWEMNTDTIKIDFEGEVLYGHIEEEKYDPKEEEFVKETRDYYIFKYKGNYYECSKERDEDKYDVTESTKAEFLRKAETMSNTASIFRIYANPIMKQSFKYNSETQCYDLISVATMKMSLQFLSSGVRVIEELSSVEKMESSIYDIDKTTVTVPNDIKALVDEFIASQE